MTVDPRRQGGNSTSPGRPRQWPWRRAVARTTGRLSRSLGRPIARRRPRRAARGTRRRRIERNAGGENIVPSTTSVAARKFHKPSPPSGPDGQSSRSGRCVTQSEQPVAEDPFFTSAACCQPLTSGRCPLPRRTAKTATINGPMAPG